MCRFTARPRSLRGSFADWPPSLASSGPRSAWAAKATRSTGRRMATASWCMIRLTQRVSPPLPASSPMSGRLSPPWRASMINEAQQIDQLNRLPLNLEAEAWLRKAGETPDPDFLYLLLLLQWGLGKKLPPLSADAQNILEID